MASGHLQRTPPLTPPRRHRPRTNDVRVRVSHRFLPRSLRATRSSFSRASTAATCKRSLQSEQKNLRVFLFAAHYRRLSTERDEENRTIPGYSNSCRPILSTLLLLPITAKCQYSIFARGPRLIKATDARRSGGSSSHTAAPLSLESVFPKMLKRHICAEPPVKV